MIDNCVCGWETTLVKNGRLSSAHQSSSSKLSYRPTANQYLMIWIPAHLAVFSSAHAANEATWNLWYYKSVEALINNSIYIDSKYWMIIGYAHSNHAVTVFSSARGMYLIWIATANSANTSKFQTSFRDRYAFWLPLLPPQCLSIRWQWLVQVSPLR